MNQLLQLLIRFPLKYYSKIKVICLRIIILWLLMLTLCSLGYAQTIINKSLCEGDSIVLHTYDLWPYDGSFDYKYTWSGPNSFSQVIEWGFQAGSPADIVIHNVTTAEMGDYILTVQQSSIQYPGRYSISIDIVPVPVLTSNSPVCLGTTLQLGVSGSLNYSWTGPNDFLANVTNPTISNVTYADSSWYVVTASNPGCSATDSIRVEVGEKIVASSNSPSSSAICTGDTLKLYGEPSGHTYSWTGPDGFTSDLQNPILPAATASMATGINDYYHLSVMGDNLCTTSDTTQVKINVSPIEPIVLDTTRWCENGVANFYANSTGPPDNYYWAGPNDFESNEQLISFQNASTSLSGTYYVDAIAANGCVTSDSIELIINPLPKISIETNSPVCSGDSLGISGVGGTSFVWWRDDSYLSQEQSLSYLNANSLLTGNYKLIGSDENNCSNTVYMDIVVNDLPNYSLVDIVSNSPVCSTDTLQLSIDGGGTYDWTGPDGFTASAKDTFITGFTNDLQGYYKAIVTNESGCSRADSIYAYALELPSASVSNNSPICEGSDLKLMASGGLSYIWTGPDNFYSEQQNPIIENAGSSVNGKYYVKILGSNSCSVLDSTVVSLTPIISRVYVDSSATGSNTGLNWTDAFTDLQSALDFECFDTIWMAKGTYIPNTDPDGSGDNRRKTFSLEHDMVLIGGFAGTETSLSQRTLSSITAYPTILSGDLDALASIDGDAYHVIKSNSTSSHVVIDGVTITMGNAIGSGGAISATSDLVVRNCLFENNAASSGGVIYSESGSLEVSHCRFINNIASVYGGAIYKTGGNGSIDNSYFERNTSTRGGAVYLSNTLLEIDQCSFINNSILTSGSGGAIAVVSQAEVAISNNVFIENKASFGSAILNLQADVEIWNSTFFRNTATVEGAVTTSQDGVSTVKNSVFWENTSLGHGVPSLSEISHINNGVTTVTYSSLQNANTAVNYSPYDGTTGFIGSGEGNIYQLDPRFIDTADVAGLDDILGTNDDGLRLEQCSPLINTGDTIGVTYTHDLSQQLRVQQDSIDIGAYESPFLKYYFTIELNVTSGGPLCIGSEISLMASTVETVDITSFEFFVNDISVQKGSSPTYSSDAFVNGDRVHVVATSNVCDVTSSELTLAVYSVPQATIITNAPLCVNETLEMSVVGGSTYDWSGPLDFDADQASITIENILLENAGLYAVSVSEESGCSETYNAYVYVKPHLEIVYVDSSAIGANNGTSWTDAYTDLQSAFDHECFDTIWVAKGTYFPSKDFAGDSFEYLSRDFVFSIPNSKVIYGGFAGDEVSFSQRSLNTMSANPTILSGDIGSRHDDSDNVYHVVALLQDSEQALLDGIIISDGNANGFGEVNFGPYQISRRYGAGLISHLSSTRIVNCQFINNKGINGAGLYNQMSNHEMSNISFVNNRADSLGGGVYNLSSDIILLNSYFEGNMAPLEGGGAMFNLGSSPTIYRNHFIMNSSKQGGAIANLSASNPNISNSFFINNTASYAAGALGNIFSNPTVKNCVFVGNSAQGGGALANSNSSPRIVNSTFYQNQSYQGGAILNDGQFTSVTLTNSILWGNKKFSFSTFGFNATVAGADIENTNASSISIDYSSLQLANTTAMYPIALFNLNSANHFGTDPLFASTFDLDGADNVYGTLDDGLAIENCDFMDSGSDFFVTDTEDITGKSRIIGDDIDLGAYENDPLNGGVICKPPCSLTEYLFTDLTSGQHLIEASLSSGTIYGFSKISGSADVTFHAQSIELSIGFQVDQGAVFSAGPGGCSED